MEAPGVVVTPADANLPDVEVEVMPGTKIVRDGVEYTEGDRLTFPWQQAQSHIMLGHVTFVGRA